MEPLTSLTQMMTHHKDPQGTVPTQLWTIEN
jgi:hypothetical protein